MKPTTKRAAQKPQPKQEAERFFAITPPLHAQFLHIDKPDTEGQFADGKYKVTANAPKTDGWSEFAEVVAACSQAVYGRDDITPLRDGDQTTRIENAGTWVLTAKTQFQPPLYDADGNEWEGTVGRDAIVRLEVELIPHNAGGSAGIAARLLSVQVLGAGQQRRQSAFAKGNTPATRAMSQRLTQSDEDREQAHRETVAEKLGAIRAKTMARA